MALKLRLLSGKLGLGLRVFQATFSVLWRQEIAGVLQCAAVNWRVLFARILVHVSHFFLFDSARPTIRHTRVVQIFL